MGLDQFVFKIAKSEGIVKEVDFPVPESANPVEVKYWRKHPNLHGWMHDLYAKKGGANAQFNCDNVQLTEQDLDDLREAITSFSLPKTQGFFFGGYDGKDLDELKDDLKFIDDAKRAIKQGYDIYYTSWW